MGHGPPWGARQEQEGAVPSPAPLRPTAPHQGRAGEGQGEAWGICYRLGASGIVAFIFSWPSWTQNSRDTRKAESGLVMFLGGQLCTQSTGWL